MSERIWDAGVTGMPESDLCSTGEYGRNVGFDGGLVARLDETGRAGWLSHPIGCGAISAFES